MNNVGQPELALAALGFTEIEAAIYCELLRGPPATGYRLAKAIGKGPANVYQALASLTQKGAVMVDDGDTKTYRPTPPADVLSGLQRGFESARERAQDVLKNIRSETSDDRIYQLRNAGQIYERAESIVGAARDILLFDLFTEPLTRLMPSLLEAHARGVTIAGLTYGALPPSPFLIVRARSSAVVAEHWPGQQLSLIADASEHLVALLSADGTTALHGVWSDSAYLSCLQHSGAASEIQVAAGGLLDDALAQLSLFRAAPRGLTRLTGSMIPARTKRS